MSNANKAADDGEHRIAADLYKDVLRVSENMKDATLFNAQARQYLAIELVCLKEYDEADKALVDVFGVAKELWAASAALGENTPNLRRRKKIGMLLKENPKMSFNYAAYFESNGNYEKAVLVFKENLSRPKQLKYTTFAACIREDPVTLIAGFTQTCFWSFRIRTSSSQHLILSPLFDTSSSCHLSCVTPTIISRPRIFQPTAFSSNIWTTVVWCFSTLSPGSSGSRNLPQT